MRTLPLFLLSVCLLSAAVFAQNPTVVTQTVQATDVPRAIPDVGHITSTVTFPVSGTIVSMELFSSSSISASVISSWISLLRMAMTSKS
jgi:glycine cleavage system protein P-like pyridoxal-binding family